MHVIRQDLLIAKAECHDVADAQLFLDPFHVVPDVVVGRLILHDVDDRDLTGEGQVVDHGLSVGRQFPQQTADPHPFLQPVEQFHGWIMRVNSFSSITGTFKLSALVRFAGPMSAPATT